MSAPLWAVLLVGAGVGFLGGAFGKGGSAVATPLLAALGVPPYIAVAAPLPATVPSTSVATLAYWRQRLLDWRIVGWSLAVGIPATVLGAVATRWIPGATLVVVTDVMVVVLGVRFALRPQRDHESGHAELAVGRIVVVSALTGLAAGLLANSGGFLLAPLYLLVLRLPIKQAFACSLAVSAVLAVPGTIVHAVLGHIDWATVGAFGLASVPLSYVGARVAIRADSTWLERAYGIALAVLGTVLLVTR